MNNSEIASKTDTAPKTAEAYPETALLLVAKAASADQENSNQDGSNLAAATSPVVQSPVVEKLEQQLADMQALLARKNQQLAGLQQAKATAKLQEVWQKTETSLNVLADLGKAGLSMLGRQLLQRLEPCPDAAQANNDQPISQQKQENLVSILAELPDLPVEQTADEFNFNFDFEPPKPTRVILEPVEPSDSEFADTDVDEFESKIDLAKAYVDMDDITAAKSLIAEVLANGSVEQQQIAQALLDELDV